MGGHPGNEALCQLGVLGRGILVRVVEQEDHIQVGHIAQFLAAQLAIRDDGELRHLAVARGHRLPDGLDGGCDDGVGQRRQVVGQLFHRQVAGQVLGQQVE